MKVVDTSEMIDVGSSDRGFPAGVKVPAFARISDGVSL